MQKNRLLIIGIVFLVLIGMTLLFGNRKKRVNWRETYADDSMQPYGTEVLLELLKSYFEGKELVRLEEKLEKSLPKKTNEATSYLFIGSGLWLDSLDVQQLLAYTRSGNTALIASKAIPDKLIKALYSSNYICDEYWGGYDNRTRRDVKMSLKHPNFSEDSASFSYIAFGEKEFNSWAYIDEAYLCNEYGEGMLSIGMVNDSLTNFVKINHGAGAIYLHTNPVCFTNIQLLDWDKMDYINAVLSHFPEGTIYWDSHSQIPEYAVNPAQGPRLSRENPLQYILSQPPLAWAWYILLGLGLIYLFFRSKRRQRIIPVLEKNENTSLEFLATIGRLHFLRNSHKQLGVEMVRLFKTFIKRRYQIQGQHIGEEAVERLAARSQMSKESIRKILMLGNNIETASFVSENTLINFHNALDDFYKNCK